MNALERNIIHEENRDIAGDLSLERLNNIPLFSSDSRGPQFCKAVVARMPGSTTIAPIVIEFYGDRTDEKSVLSEAKLKSKKLGLSKYQLSTEDLNKRAHYISGQDGACFTHGSLSATVDYPPDGRSCK